VFHHSASKIAPELNKGFSILPMILYYACEITLRSKRIMRLTPKFAYAFSDFGLDKLYQCEMPQVPCPPHCVRLEMRAVSLNFRDLLLIKGLYNPRQALPLVPCSDGVGRISEIGSEVTQYQVGDRVVGVFAPDWQEGPPTSKNMRQTLGGPLPGMLCQERILPEQSIVKVPDYLTDTQAATLPCAALTAYNALLIQGNIKKGQTVLALGSGGVSVFGLQIAKAKGAKVIVTSSSDLKLERLRLLGADHTLNHQTSPQWARTVREITQGQGVDHVIEVGGSGTLEQSLKAVKVGGTVSLIGVLGGNRAPLNILPILMNQIRVQGIFVGHRAGLMELMHFMAQKQITPVIDRVFPFLESPQAFETLESGMHIGKICISFVSHGK
jgi:NADPH:quinone reductase-like Zn-dependent oxidoreductase